jgi:hypothetical protein
LASCEKDKVVLTTRKASIGVDILFKSIRAFTVSTEEFNTMDDLLQPLGRSSRKDPTLSLLGAVFTLSRCNTIDSLRQGLLDKSSDLLLYSATCR